MRMRGAVGTAGLNMVSVGVDRIINTGKISKTFHMFIIARMPPKF